MTAVQHIICNVAAFSASRRSAASWAFALAAIMSIWASPFMIQAAPLAPADLRLVPFPKEIRTLPQGLALRDQATVTAPDSPVSSEAAGDLRQELADIARAECRIETSPAPQGPSPWVLWLGPEKPADADFQQMRTTMPDQPEGYALSVGQRGAFITAKEEAGLLHGVQTLRQLVRANLRGGQLPGLEIRDWPSMGYRGFSDDITRGPSPTPATLRREIRLTAELKMSFFTYYLEYQYAFAKHPDIGPKDGSLRPEELAGLVKFAKRYGVEIIGNQQSFGHFGAILAHDEYKSLRETPDILDPTNEASYRLLDDLYSEQAPILESPLFNVCCDETYGLGTGPSKPLADKIGIGGVYVRHIKRIHDLLKSKYGKRMMMWGDIILQHPQYLPEIPKDTVMLAWGYHAAPSFEPDIIPFARSGYQFFVCPGVNCWNLILPNFEVAAANIHNFVRDGAKHGAMGMLNTTWDDDGENLAACNWHGLAWGAECAWNASATAYEDFNRRIGAVLFGEEGDRFGQAIALLGRTHGLAGFDRMRDAAFWTAESGQLPSDEGSARRQAEALRTLVQPAIEHLKAARAGAKANADLLDCFLFGAERMQAMADRRLAFLDAAKCYAQASQPNLAPEAAEALLRRADQLLRDVRGEHARLKQRYVVLWNRENRPYALDRVTRRFDASIARYDGVLEKLDRATKEFVQARRLPAAADIGLEIVEAGVRRTRPSRVSKEMLRPRAAWVAPHFRKRIGIAVGGGGVARQDLPVELDVSVPTDAAGTVQLTEVEAKTGSQSVISSQILQVHGRARLFFVATGELPQSGKRCFFLYFDSDQPLPGKPPVDGARCSDAPGGMKWLENGLVRLLVGPEGGHIYRWEVTGLDNRDLTQPGDRDWQGFADLGGDRRKLSNRIEVLASGPVLARIRCPEPSGSQKTISLFAGVPWVEVNLSEGTGWFWCYDDAAVMGADTLSPGNYLFSDGQTGAVKRSSSTPDCQVRGPNSLWGAKFLAEGPMLALVTPGTPSLHVVGPGGGMGGVGIEGSTPVAHFAIYGGMCPISPKQVLDRLADTLDYGRPPVTELYGLQQR